MSRLFLYIRRFLPWYAAGVVCTLASAALAMVLPMLARDAINAVQAHQNLRLVRLSELMIAVAIPMGVTRCLSRVITFNTGRNVEYEMRNDLFAHLARLGPDFYQRLKTGDLMSRMINDLSAVRMMVGMGVLSFSETPVTYLLALSFMFSLNVKLTLATLAPYVVLFACIRIMTRLLMERSLQVQEGLPEGFRGVAATEGSAPEAGREGERFSHGEYSPGA